MVCVCEVVCVRQVVVLLANWSFLLPSVPPVSCSTWGSPVHTCVSERTCSPASQGGGLRQPRSRGATGSWATGAARAHVAPIFLLLSLLGEGSRALGGLYSRGEHDMDIWSAVQGCPWFFKALILISLLYVPSMYFRLAPISKLVRRSQTWIWVVSAWLTFEGSWESGYGCILVVRTGHVRNIMMLNRIHL